MSEEISKKFFTIGDVAEMIGEAPSLIRFWEKEFNVIKPFKTSKGTRKYNQNDIAIIKHIHYLVKTKGYTLDGAKEAMKKEKRLKNNSDVVAKLMEVRDFLKSLNDKLQ